MNDLERMEADRALRDAARTLLSDDITRIRRGLEERSIPARALDRTTEGAVDLLEDLSRRASEHKGLIATVLAAFTLWLARNPLLDVIGAADNKNEETNDE